MYDGRDFLNEYMFYTPRQLRKKKEKIDWIMSYNRLTAIVSEDEKEVIYIEEYGPENGFWIEEWRAYHYQRTSKLVNWSVREGGVTIVSLKQGRSELRLIPSLSPLGISECKVEGNLVKITFEGIGGAGVSASFSRGMAEGAKKVEVIEEGGGRKHGKACVYLPKKKLLLVGIDDTDDEEKGATYALAHNLATKWSKKVGGRYVSHVNVQLFPYNKFKTKNCFATVLGIILDNLEDLNKFKEGFWSDVKSKSYSPSTGVVYCDGLVKDMKLKKHSQEVKRKQFETIDETKKLISRLKLDARSMGNGWGLVGALASLDYVNRPGEAAELPELVTK